MYLATNFSIPASVTFDGVSFVPRLAKAVMMPWSAFLNAFRHVSLPLPTKLPVLSVPVSAWTAGKAATFTSTMGFKGINLHFFHNLHLSQTTCPGTSPGSASVQARIYQWQESRYECLLPQSLLPLKHAIATLYLPLLAHFLSGSYHGASPSLVSKCHDKAQIV